MIRRVGSSLPSFRTVEFHEGLNIVVAERRTDSATTDSRNGTGKSSLLEIVHYVLGAEAGPKHPFRAPPLDRHTFTLDLDVGGRAVRATRGADERQVVVVTDLETGAVERVPVAAWRDRLGLAMFGIGPGQPRYSPTFRSCLSYMVRRRSEGALAVPEKQHAQQRTWDVQANLSLLFGLDWELARRWQLVRDREKVLQTLRAEIAEQQGEAPDAASLRSEVAVAESTIREIRDGVETFVVVPQYRAVEAEVSAFNRDIRAASNRAVIARDLLAQLRAEPEPDAGPDSGAIDALYRAAGVQLPGVVLAGFDDVKAFHASVVANRRAYLAEETTRATAELAAAETERDRLTAERARRLRLLQSGGAFETLLDLQRDLATREARLETLRNAYEAAVAAESEKVELKLFRQQLEASLSRELDERATVLGPAFVVFEQLSRRLYGERSGSLTVAADENGPQFKTALPRSRSAGISNMKIWCFDMTVATMLARRRQGPGFVVHDSHLFDGVDERQRAAALTVGAELADAEGLQYIVTANSDELPDPTEALRDDSGGNGRPVGWARYTVGTVLTDDENGGLFGTRF